MKITPIDFVRLRRNAKKFSVDWHRVWAQLDKDYETIPTNLSRQALVGQRVRIKNLVEEQLNETPR